MGLRSTEYWLLTAVGVLALILVLVNIFTAMTNADVRSEVNERQQFINQSVQLGRLHSQLVQGLATLSARSGDEELRAALAQHGIEFSVKDQAAGTSAGDAPAAQPAATANQGGDAQ